MRQEHAQLFGSARFPFGWTSRTESARSISKRHETGLGAAAPCSGRVIQPGDRRARLGGRQRQRVEGVVTGPDRRCAEGLLDPVGRIRNPPGTDRAGGPLQRMRSIHPGLLLRIAMDGAQEPHALLREQRQQLAFEFMVAVGLAGEMLDIDRGLGHRVTRNA
ncbi:hypothetical protein BOSEA31B_10893 [Hyphomicrobiales bacterium]|nr:hypothetical protein BOSEA31B_10893 [Hyphomicrobiales bacterium]CAH1700745.1 hypothetical protein BOSEA1005_20444 [Hyphomicrobiales bacterium]CAI0344618.1 hypothetical protein BO1005MUT1_340035 [Hyphomicrobiales bacterium]